MTKRIIVYSILGLTLSGCGIKRETVLSPATDLTSIMQRIGLLEASDAAQNARLDALEREQSNQAQTIIQVQNDIQVNVSNLSTAIESLKAQDQAIASSLASVLVRLGSFNYSDITALQAELSDLKRRVTALENSESQNETLIQIETINLRLAQIELSQSEINSTLTAQLDSLSRGMTSLSRVVDNLDSRLSSRIADLLSRVQSLDSRELADKSELLAQIAATHAEIQATKAKLVQYVANPCDANEVFQKVDGKVYGIVNKFQSLSIKTANVETLKSIKALTCNTLGIDLLGASVCLGGKLEVLNLASVTSETVTVNLLTESKLELLSGTYTKGSCSFNANSL